MSSKIFATKYQKAANFFFFFLLSLTNFNLLLTIKIHNFSDSDDNKIK